MSFRTTLLSVLMVSTLLAVLPAQGWSISWDKPFAFSDQHQEIGGLWSVLGAVGVLGLGYWLYKLYSPSVVRKEQKYVFGDATLVILRNYDSTKMYKPKKSEPSENFVFPDTRMNNYRITARPSTSQNFQDVPGKNIYVAPLGMIKAPQSGRTNAPTTLNNRADLFIFLLPFVPDENQEQHENQDQLCNSYKNVLKNAHAQIEATQKLGINNVNLIFKTVSNELDKPEESFKCEAEQFAKALKEFFAGNYIYELHIEVEVDPSVFEIYKTALDNTATRVVQIS